MDNLAKTKDRKMQSAFNRLYKIVFSVPKTNIPEDAYSGIRYQFTRNVPRNILEESQIFGNLIGKISTEAAISVLSIVENAKDEINRIKKEEQSSSLLSKQIAINERNLIGKISTEAAISVLSIVENAKDEINRIKKEEQSSSLLSKQIAINERRTDGDLIAEEE